MSVKLVPVYWIRFQSVRFKLLERDGHGCWHQEDCCVAANCRVDSERQLWRKPPCQGQGSEVRDQNGHTGLRPMERQEKVK